jgi:hypothetical protein
MNSMPNCYLRSVRLCLSLRDSVLNFDEARRMNVAKLPELLGAVVKAEEASP